MFVTYKDVRGGSLIRLLAPLYATTTTTWAKTWARIRSVFLFSLAVEFFLTFFVGPS